MLIIFRFIRKRNVSQRFFKVRRVIQTNDEAIRQLLAKSSQDFLYASMEEDEHLPLSRPSNHA